MPTPLANSVTFDDSTMRVELDDGRTISLPIALFARLHAGTPEQRSACEIGGHGIGLHWEALDEDLSVAGLIATYEKLGESDAAPVTLLKPQQESPAGEPFSHWGAVGMLSVGIVISLVIAIPLLTMKNCAGFLVIFGVLAAIMAGYGVRGVQERSDRLRLSAAAFLLGVSLSFAAGFLVTMDSRIDPLDRSPTFVAITMLGILASTIVAGALAVSALFYSPTR